MTSVPLVWYKSSTLVDILRLITTIYGKVSMALSMSTCGMQQWLPSFQATRINLMPPGQLLGKASINMLYLYLMDSYQVVWWESREDSLASPRDTPTSTYV